MPRRLDWLNGNLVSNYRDVNPNLVPAHKTAADPRAMELITPRVQALQIQVAPCIAGATQSGVIRSAGLTPLRPAIDAHCTARRKPQPNLSRWTVTWRRTLCAGVARAFYASGDDYVFASETMAGESSPIGRTTLSGSALILVPSTTILQAAFRGPVLETLSSFK